MRQANMPTVLASVLACATAVAGEGWTRLADIPDSEGFAGAFAGVVNDRLVVAGGANFPGKKPWQGGEKVWHDRLFVLDAPDARWREAGRLPGPLAYGVAITTPTGLACIGGSDSQRHHADAFEIRLHDDAIRVVKLPSLPTAVANMCGVMAGGRILVAGGSESPRAVAASARAWMLDLARLEAGWEEIEAVPGPGRILPAAGAVGNAVVVAGGARLSPDAEGNPVRAMLSDAYAYEKGKGWRRLADLPRPSVAAPSPMPMDELGRPLLLGGDDGSQAALPLAERRGFPRGILAWDPAGDAWVTAGEVPEGLVTTPTAGWRGRIVVPGGESRPGVRSNKVWSR